MHGVLLLYGFKYLSYVGILYGENFKVALHVKVLSSPSVFLVLRW